MWRSQKTQHVTLSCGIFQTTPVEKEKCIAFHPFINLSILLKMPSDGFMVMNMLYVLCDVGKCMQRLCKFEQDCTMFKLQMACGYCAPVKRPLFAKCTSLSKAFPAYSSRPSNPPPLSFPLVRVWGFSSPSLECGGDLWMLLQQRHLLRWIFPFSLFLKKGGFISSRPCLGHFFPSSSVLHAVAEWQILRIESRAKIVD